MSPSRKICPLASTGTAAIAAAPENAPVTRTLMRSAEVSTEPPETTAFCLATLSKICCGVTPEGGELGVVELDEDLLRPHADDVDLVDVRNPQQALADILGARLELGEAQAVGAEHVERGIDVAVLVVEVRAGDAGGAGRP